MIHFILIRHGETIGNKQKVYQGKTDSPLTTVGRRQIQRHVREVAKYRPDIIFSSELGRSIESAKILAGSLGLKPKVDQRLNEIAFGNWEGKTAEMLLKEDNQLYNRWKNGEIVVPRGGETISSLRKRVKMFIRECYREYDGKKLIIVAHGGPIRAIIAEVLKLSEKHVYSFRIDSGSLSIVAFYEEYNQLVQLNVSAPRKGIVPTECC